MFGKIIKNVCELTDETFSNCLISFYFEFNIISFITNWNFEKMYGGAF